MYTSLIGQLIGMGFGYLMILTWSLTEYRSLWLRVALLCLEAVALVIAVWHLLVHSGLIC